MSLTTEQLQLVALAASFAMPGRSWDPTVGLLEQVEDIVLNAERLAQYGPSRQLATEKSLKGRLEYLLKNVREPPLKELRVEIMSNEFNLGETKHSLKNLRHFNLSHVKAPAFYFKANTQESEVLLVGVWTAAILCKWLGFKFPSLQEHPIHAILSALVNVVCGVEGMGLGNGRQLLSRSNAFSSPPWTHQPRNSTNHPPPPPTPTNMRRVLSNPPCPPPSPRPSSASGATPQSLSRSPSPVNDRFIVAPKAYEGEEEWTMV